MKDITKNYKTEDITIVWKPDMCIHSRICWTNLSNVFNPSERPWIKPENATTEQLIHQINQCPSGALSYFSNKEEPKQVIAGESIVEVAENGPLLVYGNLMVKGKDGQVEQKSKVTAFCRCGASGNKPYCDGTHKKIDFKV